MPTYFFDSSQCHTPVALFIRPKILKPLCSALRSAPLFSSAALPSTGKNATNTNTNNVNAQLVHLTDIQPRQGPISGGTRLYLSGSNLNIGSRLQVLLDELPCAIDR